MPETSPFRDLSLQRNESTIDQTLALTQAGAGRLRPQRPEEGGRLPAIGQAFIDNLLRLQLATPSVVVAFLDRHEGNAPAFTSAEALGEALIQGGVLTSTSWTASWPERRTAWSWAGTGSWTGSARAAWGSSSWPSTCS